jgi:hypothetical protein
MAMAAAIKAAIAPNTTNLKLEMKAPKVIATNNKIKSETN